MSVSRYGHSGDLDTVRGLSKFLYVLRWLGATIDPPIWSSCIPNGIFEMPSEYCPGLVRTCGGFSSVDGANVRS
jgi:hypothetical protein